MRGCPSVAHILGKQSNKLNKVANLFSCSGYWVEMSVSLRVTFRLLRPSGFSVQAGFKR